jgi:hypothetical protein
MASVSLKGVGVGRFVGDRRQGEDTAAHVVQRDMLLLCDTPTGSHVGLSNGAINSLNRDEVRKVKLSP